MTTTAVTPELAKISIRLLDDAYMAWCAAAACCHEAMRGWCDAALHDRAAANAAYRAALDREEAAADDLARLSLIAGAAGR